jgi:hypothetical protein
VLLNGVSLLKVWHNPEICLERIKDVTKNPPVMPVGSSCKSESKFLPRCYIHNAGEGIIYCSKEQSRLWYSSGS